MQQQTQQMPQTQFFLQWLLETQMHYVAFKVWEQAKLSGKKLETGLFLTLQTSLTISV